jgi:hypothetical protein
VTVRIVIWNVFDSKTTVDELRAQLPDLPDDAHWIANDAQERFGVIAFGELPDLRGLQQLLGAEPAVGEEYDLLD